MYMLSLLCHFICVNKALPSKVIELSSEDSMTQKWPLFLCIPAAAITVSQIINKYSVYTCHQKELMGDLLRAVACLLLFI